VIRGCDDSPHLGNPFTLIEFGRRDSCGATGYETFMLETHTELSQETQPWHVE
jgi:hypothetical protein